MYLACDGAQKNGRGPLESLANVGLAVDHQESTKEEENASRVSKWKARLHAGARRMHVQSTTGNTFGSCGGANERSVCCQRPSRLHPLTPSKHLMGARAFQGLLETSEWSSLSATCAALLTLGFSRDYFFLCDNDLKRGHIHSLVVLTLTALWGICPGKSFQPQRFLPPNPQHGAPHYRTPSRRNRKHFGNTKMLGHNPGNTAKDNVVRGSVQHDQFAENMARSSNRALPLYTCCIRECYNAAWAVAAGGTE